MPSTGFGIRANGRTPLMPWAVGSSHCSKQWRGRSSVGSLLKSPSCALQLQRTTGQPLHVVAHQESEDDRERDAGNHVGRHQRAELGR